MIYLFSAIICAYIGITIPAVLLEIPYCFFIEKQFFIDCVAIARTLTTELFDIPILVYEDWNVIYQDMHVGSNLDKLTFSTNFSAIL